MNIKSWLNRGRTVDNVIHVLESDRGILKSQSLEKKLEDKKRKLFELKEEIYSVIEKVDDDKYFLVLYGRYILMKSWEEIAHENHYSLRHTFRLHGEALNKVKSIKSNGNIEKYQK